MKKSLLISIILLLVVACFATSVNATSADSTSKDYTIDIPSSFKQYSSSVYVMDNGNNFNVQVTTYDEKKEGYPYTQANLDKVAEQMEKTMKANVKKKEITTCTKNNYKCMHLLSEISGKFCDQYAIASGNKIYTLTVTVSNESDLGEADIKAVVDTFTLKNYQEPKEGMNIVLIGAIVGVIAGVVVAIVMATKKKKAQQ